MWFEVRSRNGELLGLSLSPLRARPRLTASPRDEERGCDALGVCRRHMGGLVHMVAKWLVHFADNWGLPDEFEPGGEIGLGWQRAFGATGREEFVLLASPGETANEIPDLTERWPHWPDRADT